MKKTGAAIFFDISRPSYDPEKAFNYLGSTFNSQVWNFLRGLFVIRSSLLPKQIHKKLEETEDRYIVFKVDPSALDGKLPERAWDSWFVDVFWDDVDGLCSDLDWPKDALERRREDYLKRAKDLVNVPQS